MDCDQDSKRPKNSWRKGLKNFSLQEILPLSVTQKHNNPWITIHGHSHSAVDRMKGKFAFDIGSSKSVLVGAGNDPNVVNFLTLDIKKRLIERHEI
jgi:hypothetical protein